MKKVLIVLIFLIISSISTKFTVDVSFECHLFAKFQVDAYLMEKDSGDNFWLRFIDDDDELDYASKMKRRHASVELEGEESEFGFTEPYIFYRHNCTKDGSVTEKSLFPGKSL
ncbi:unnamed protein product [Caenorhabditis auriculariae]|uniref:Transthyretin-like family protein n=1 Tax=Caenorhabditis auriculariae TaxID=2777116 RepID=A0A8S1HER7_9PELO|nr:unnamed protein product [Caenorhabditis auriculariae]